LVFDFHQFQDSKRNYYEAGRCYREALAIFRQLRRNPQLSGHRIRDFLNTEVVQVRIIRLRRMAVIRIQIHGIPKFLGLPDSLVRGTDPAPDPSSFHHQAKQ
jgi:hypothetical protein